MTEQPLGGRVDRGDAPVGSSETTPAVMFGEDRLDVAAALLELELLVLRSAVIWLNDATSVPISSSAHLRRVAEADAVLPVALRDLARALASRWIGTVMPLAR